MKSWIRWPVLWWLRFWAKLALAGIKPVIIGVTGSAGKSSAVAAIEIVAKLKFPNLKVAKKANSETGIPADILGLHFTNYSLLDWLRICISAPFSFFLLPSTFDCYLVEMGIDEPTPPKNMGYLLTILKPQIAVLLNAFPVHAEQFAKQLNLTDPAEIAAAIAAEKGKIITHNPALATAIVNADQPRLAGFTLPRKHYQTITFGTSDYAHVKITAYSPALTGTKFSLKHRQNSLHLKLPGMVLPEYYGHTLATAIACGIALGLPTDQFTTVLESNFTLPPGRGQIFDGIKDTILIDSSYNSSTKPTIGCLKLLDKIAGRRQKIAVLGDMQELGVLAQREHEKVAQVASETADKIVLVGPLMKQYALPVLEKSHRATTWFPIAGAAATYLQDSLQGKEVVLIKGSQNTIFMEIVVEKLLAHPADVSKLCRRGDWWDRQRAAYR